MRDDLDKDLLVLLYDVAAISPILAVSASNLQ
jgi:hypothetical protein